MNEQKEINLFERHDPFSNGQVFDANAVTYDQDGDYWKQLYWLQRHIVQSFRKANLPNRLAKDYAARYGRDILDRAKAKSLPTEPAV
jgi:hypothetical protein